MIDYETDVLVVGTGPAGAAAALALATYGVRVHAITRYRWLSNTPRAHITNQRAMEALRDLGVEAEVRRYGSDWKVMGDTLITSSLAGPEIARIRTWGTGDDQIGAYTAASPSPMLDIPQPYLESVLVRNAAERGAEFSYSTEYVGHDQDENGVTVHLVDRRSGRAYDVRTQYLIGADGARSTVAEHLNLPIEGEMDRAATAYVEFSADLTRYVEHRPSILYWIATPSAAYGEIGLGLLRAVRPWTQWIAGWGFDRTQGDPDLSEATVRRRVQDYIGDDSIEITINRSSIWLVNEAHATSYDSGRVFCAGDAVHRHPPSGGLGSNTSLQDTFNLAWKLAYVVKGWAAPSLLGSYTPERAPVGKQIVTRANTSRRQFAALNASLRNPESDDPVGGALARIRDPRAQGVEVRAALGAALQTKNYEFNAHGVELNQRYVSPAVLPDAAGPEAWPHDPELVAQATTRPGAKVPHVWLVGRDGRRLSTLDLVGHGRLVLLTGLSGAAWRAAAAQLDHPALDVVVIGEPGAEDLYYAWQRVRETHEAGAVLVRPDGYVGWRHLEPVWDDTSAKDLLQSALSALLGR